VGVVDMNNFSYSWNTLAAYLTTVTFLNFEMQKQVLVLGKRIGENDVINYVIYIPHAYPDTYGKIILEDQTEKGWGIAYYVEGGFSFGGNIVNKSIIFQFYCPDLLGVWLI